MSADTPLRISTWIENFLLTTFIFLVLICVTMGKALRQEVVNIPLKLITAIMCLFNLAVVVYAFANIFQKTSPFLTYLVIGIFLYTYFVPPFLYDFCFSFENFFSRQLPGILSYIFMMPLYQIILQVFSYANLHDVTWGNRTVSVDQSLQNAGGDPKVRKLGYKMTRLFIFMLWMISNLMVGYLMSAFGKNNITWVLQYVSWGLIGFQGTKIVASLIYLMRIECCVKRTVKANMKREAAREIARIVRENAQYQVIEVPETTPDKAEKHTVENRKDAYIDEGGPRENAGRNSGFAMPRDEEMKDHRISKDSNAPYFGPPKSKQK